MLDLLTDRLEFHLAGQNPHVGFGNGDSNGLLDFQRFVFEPLREGRDCGQLDFAVVLVVETGVRDDERVGPVPFIGTVVRDHLKWFDADFVCSHRVCADE